MGRKCQGVGPTKPDGCEETATVKVRFQDKTTAVLCRECALQIVQMSIMAPDTPPTATMEPL